MLPQVVRPFPRGPREDMSLETFRSGLPVGIRESLEAFERGGQLVEADAGNLRDAAILARESAMSPTLREDVAVCMELKAAIVDLILVEDPWESDAR